MPNAPGAEDVMELVLDPAALAGLSGLIALSGWALGRTQNGRNTPEAPPATEPVPAALALAKAGEPADCQQRALEERRAIFDQPLALSELHDHVSSIRRMERVFEQELSGPKGMLALPLRDMDDVCRYFGLSGRPTCPGPANRRCHHDGPCMASGLCSSVTGQRPDPALATPPVSRASPFAP
ncbi:hypothetical protein [Erythrobacter dokdonensis]|nr:hypothetical protein [Erythrobacter dokdonensis]